MKNIKPFSPMNTARRYISGRHIMFKVRERQYFKSMDTVCVIIIILAALYFWYGWFMRPAESQSLIKPGERAEIERRLAARKLPRNVTVEISEKGYRFQWEGGWYKL